MLAVDVRHPLPFSKSFLGLLGYFNFFNRPTKATIVWWEWVLLGVFKFKKKLRQNNTVLAAAPISR